MFFKLVIIALFSIILAGCNNSNNTADITPPSSDYSRLNYNDNTNYSVNRENSSYDNNSGDKNVVDDIKKDIYGNPNDVYLKNVPQDENTSDNKKLLKTYTSPILTKDPNMYHNITLLRDKLNGYVLKNGETFSFNEICRSFWQR